MRPAAQIQTNSAIRKKQMCGSVILEGKSNKPGAVKVLSHCVMFRAPCLATPLRDKVHDTLHSVTYLATAENVATQFAETIAESRTRFHFLQRFQATFRFAAQSNEPVAKCERLCNVSCNLSRNALRDKLHEKLQCDSALSVV